jgi:hypothetical protein
VLIERGDGTHVVRPFSQLVPRICPPRPVPHRPAARRGGLVYVPPIAVTGSVGAAAPGCPAGLRSAASGGGAAGIRTRPAPRPRPLPRRRWCGPPRRPRKSGRRPSYPLDPGVNFPAAFICTFMASAPRMSPPSSPARPGGTVDEAGKRIDCGARSMWRFAWHEILVAMKASTDTHTAAEAMGSAS